jgi:antitoxin ParD1/3/4
MSKNTSVSLGDHFAEFIEEQVTRGRFSPASDVVRAGLRLLEEQEARLSALQAALVEGEGSGEPEPFDFDGFLEDKRRASATRVVIVRILHGRNELRSASPLTPH